MVHLPHPPSQATADFESYQDRRQFLSTAAMGIVSASAASLLSTRPAPAAESGAIRPFHIDIPKEGLVNLRERVMMTRWPDRETVADPSQGVQLATMQQLARYWADGLRLAQGGSAAERLAAVRHRDRRARHSFHSRSLET